MATIRIWRMAGLLVALAVAASAGPITFVFTGFGSGTIGGTPFTNAGFTITGVADTDNRESFLNGFWIDHTSASIAIDGVGDFTFISGTRTFVANDVPSVGFSRGGASGTDLFDSNANPAFATWYMLSSIGPVSGTDARVIQWDDPPINTSGGVLVFDSGSSDWTFQATLGPSAVPEAGSWLLMLVGLAGAGALKRICRA